MSEYLNEIRHDAIAKQKQIAEVTEEDIKLLGCER